MTPLFAVLPLGLSLTDARATGYMLFELPRTNKRDYLLGKGLSACLSGFLTLFLTAFLCAVFLSICFPPFAPARDKTTMENVYYVYHLSVPKDAQLYAWIHFGDWSGAVAMLTDCALWGLGGMMLSALGLIISVYVRNRYAVLALPFAFHFALTLGIELLSSYFPWAIYLRPTGIFNPVAISILPPYLLFPLLLGITGALFLLYFYSGKRRLTE